MVPWEISLVLSYDTKRLIPAEALTQNNPLAPVRSLVHITFPVAAFLAISFRFRADRGAALGLAAFFIQLRQYPEPEVRAGGRRKSTGT